MLGSTKLSPRMRIVAGLVVPFGARWWTPLVEERSPLPFLPSAESSKKERMRHSSSIRMFGGERGQVGSATEKLPTVASTNPTSAILARRERVEREEIQSLGHPSTILTHLSPTATEKHTGSATTKTASTPTSLALSKRPNLWRQSIPRRLSASAQLLLSRRPAGRIPSDLVHP
jgi:hypothetical protein